jgi:hypothetical protein
VRDPVRLRKETESTDCLPENSSYEFPMTTPSKPHVLAQSFGTKGVTLRSRPELFSTIIRDWSETRIERGAKAMSDRG